MIGVLSSDIALQLNSNRSFGTHSGVVASSSILIFVGNEVANVEKCNDILSQHFGKRNEPEYLIFSMDSRFISTYR